ncbi:MAG: hypothetical protein HYV02_06660 [Deltaproteobacteria bacterium]|nr:hypothetical protein [Deltaproteobacteria bacterium]
MNNKMITKSVRITLAEESKIVAFISEHPYLQQFSTVVRAAVWEYITANQRLQTSLQRPSFLWDYDLAEGDIHAILNGPQRQRLWLVARILEHGKWDEVWRYVSRGQIAYDLPHLRLPIKTKQHWAYAIRQWRG